MLYWLFFSSSSDALQLSSVVASTVSLAVAMTTYDRASRRLRHDVFRDSIYTALLFISHVCNIRGSTLRISFMSTSIQFPYSSKIQITLFQDKQQISEAIILEHLYWHIDKSIIYWYI